MNYQDLMPSLLEISINAGHAILDVYHGDNDVNIEIKKDKTPVTQADIAAHDIILAGLTELTPEIPVLSEEDANISFKERSQWQRYWLVDPLDGTKEFIHRTDEFTVNIALIENGQSKIGVIYVPIKEVFYYAIHGDKAYKQVVGHKPIEIKSRAMSEKPCVVAISRRHSVKKAQPLFEQLGDYKKMTRGSSLKTCIIAEGIADIYPCFGPTSEWDMGAAMCIIETAGGMMVDLDFNPISFNQKSSLLNPPLLVVGDKEYDWQQLINKFKHTLLGE